MVVIVGVDPHKKSVTFEAIDEQGHKVATDRFGPVTFRDPTETFAVFTSPLCLGCSLRLFRRC